MKASFLATRRIPGPGMIRLAALMLVAATLAACSLSRPSPVKRTYLLEPAAPQAAAAQKPFTLRIGTINVGSPFRGRQLVYRTDDLKYEADFYSEFFVTPASMVSETTAKALSSARLFKRVLPAGAPTDEGDFVLDGFVNELYGDARDQAKPAAVLSITFYLSSMAPLSGPTVIWSREYQQRVPLSGTNADALVRAWNGALTTILADLTNDLAAMNLAQK